MTGILGTTDGQTILLGADSAGSNDNGEIYTIPAPKVFGCGSYVMGVAGSYRIAQTLRFKADLPAPPATDLEPFLVRHLVPAIAAAVRADGAACHDHEILGSRTTLLLGCRGQLWYIGPDLTVLPEGSFAAIGSGHIRAYAALYALQAAGVEPARRRVELALEAAAEFTTTVRGPWHFVSLDADGRIISSGPTADSRSRPTGAHLLT